MTHYGNDLLDNTSQQLKAEVTRLHTDAATYTQMIVALERPSVVDAESSERVDRQFLEAMKRKALSSYVDYTEQVRVLSTISLLSHKYTD